MILQCNSKAVTKAAGVTNRYDLTNGICAYWQDASAVHKFFIDEVQDGIEDGRQHEVTVNKLWSLLHRVEAVISSTRLVDGTLENEVTARELLPTWSGFYGGNLNYDSSYWEALIYTRDQLRRILDSVQKVCYLPFEEDGITYCDWMPIGEDDWAVRFTYRTRK